MKRLLCFTLILIQICSTWAMEQGFRKQMPTQDSADRFFGPFAQGSGQNTHERDVPSFVEDGTPDSLNKDLMELALRSAPAELTEILNGLKNPQTCELYPKEFILTGPPGTGKTTLAKAVSYFFKWPYRLIETIQLSNEYKDSCTQNLWRAILPILNTNTPRVVILEEITALTRDHNQEKTDGWRTSMSLWRLLDKLQEAKNIIFVGTTNDVSQMPTPLKNRFSDNVIEVINPSVSIRSNTILHYLKQFNGVCDESTLSFFVEQTNNLSIREIEKIIMRVIRLALSTNNNRNIQREHITEALRIWNYKRDELLKIDDPQFTMQERLQKENHEFQRKENEKQREHQETLHNQQFFFQLERYLGARGRLSTRDKDDNNIKKLLTQTQIDLLESLENRKPDSDSKGCRTM